MWCTSLSWDRDVPRSIILNMDIIYIILYLYDIYLHVMGTNGLIYLMAKMLELVLNCKCTLPRTEPGVQCGRREHEPDQDVRGQDDRGEGARCQHHREQGGQGPGREELRGRNFRAGQAPKKKPAHPVLHPYSYLHTQNSKLGTCGYFSLLYNEK